MTFHPRHAMAVVAAVVAAGTMTIPSVASADHGNRLDHICTRLVTIDERLDLIYTRLTADEETRGSLDWLAAMRDSAVAGGRPNLALALADRLAARTAAYERLVEHQDRLDDIRTTLCAEDGVEVDYDLTFGA